MNRPTTTVQHSQLLCIIGCEGKNQIVLGYTNYCFDLWLILHKKDYFNSVNNQDAYGGVLRRVYRLERGVNIKKKEANKTPQENNYYDNPDTQMNNLLKFIFQKVGVAKRFGL